VRYGVSSWVWRFPFDERCDHDLVARIAALGGDHFELGGEAVPLQDPEPLRAALESAGMTASVCAVFGAGEDLSSLDSNERAEAVVRLEQCIDTARAIGADVVGGVVCGAGRRDWIAPVERRRRLAFARESVLAAADHAAQAGVSIGIEPLNRYECNLVTTVEDALEVLDDVDDEAIGIQVDLFHASIEQVSVPDAIRQAGRRLMLVHTSDSNRGAPGTGHTDWQAIAAALCDVAFDGALVIESFDPCNPTLAALSGMRRPFARSQDALVADGIALLRELSG